ncbi:MAG TPA: divalent-cation tolerance protein CutA [Elusimicrobiales bacterium]|nr:divalent-cation tolerance protein CutA [Elusimicrobiales bacterium]
MPTAYRICFVTVGDKASARKITEGLLAERLAACVSVIEGVTSTYRWQGKIETSQELLLLIKTRASLAADVTQFVKKNHPYTVPEIIFADISDGSPEYLDWLGANTVLSANVSKDGRNRKKP